MKIAADGEQPSALAEESQALFLAPGWKAEWYGVRECARDDAVYHLRDFGMGDLSGQTHKAGHVGGPDVDPIDPLRGQDLLDIRGRFGGLDLDYQTDDGIRRADVLVQVLQVAAGANGRESADAKRRIAAEADGLLGIGGGVDHRHDDALRTEVERGLKMIECVA